MKIQKKNGLVEDFDINKIRNSIANSAEDNNIMITDSDLTNICKDIYKVIEAQKKDQTSSYEVFGIVIFKLKEMEYIDILDSYLRGALGLTKEK